MITYTTANTVSDLSEILSLQKRNLTRSLSSEEIQSEGFVTVDHSFDQLKSLNDIEKHVIAKNDDKVVAYVLAMTKKSRADISILVSMFEIFDQVIYKGQQISKWNYIVIGQVCVDKAYRGQGIFDQCYAEYKKLYQHKYDFAITEIAASNTRSLQAHKRVGFQEINSFFSPDKTEWVVVAWDWNAG